MLERPIHPEQEQLLKVSSMDIVPMLNGHKKTQKAIHKLTIHFKVQILKLAIKKHSVLAGIDYDPDGDMELKPKEDGDVNVKYKNGKMTFDEYIDEMETRTTRHSEGKTLTSGSIGLFGGFGKGTLNKN